MLRQLMTFYQTMKVSDTVPTPDQGKLIFSSCHNFLLMYQSCASWARAEGQLLYNSTSKFHHAFHLGQQGLYLNPRTSWEYGWEDFVGKMITLGHGCSHGATTMQLSVRIATKYRIALHLQFLRG